MIYRKDQGRFETVHLAVTPNALSQLTPREMIASLKRHFNGDWGDVCEADKRLNDSALIEGDTLRSEYHSSNGVRYWIITEADHSVTTILLPEDY